MYQLSRAEQAIVRKALMRSVTVIAKGTLMTEPSKTPRTDAVRLDTSSDSPDDYYRVLKHAENLERELAQAAIGISDSHRTWVPVEERVPTDDTTVIVHTHTGDIVTGWWAGERAGGWRDCERHDK